MEPMAAATAALAALDSGIKVAKGLMGLREAAKMSGPISELQRHLIDAQREVLALQRECSTLLRERDELQAARAGLEKTIGERKQYPLRQVGELGALVYAVDADPEGKYPAHYLCPTCYADRKESILQLSPNGNLYRCSREAAHKFVIRNAEPPDPIEPLRSAGPNDWMVR